MFGRRFLTEVRDKDSTDWHSASSPQVRLLLFFSSKLNKLSICCERRHISYPELGAHGRFAPGCPHLLLTVPAAHLLEQVVDEVQPKGKQMT